MLNVKSDAGDVQVVKSGKTQTVIFPADYAKQLYPKEPYRKFFTPDTSVVKNINAAFKDQYCAASDKFDKKNQMPPMSDKFCLAELRTYTYCDKQLIGYVDGFGNKIVKVKIIDFRQDPHNLKQSFTKFWINGWHGWFYQNVRNVTYHVESDLLTINDDI